MSNENINIFIPSILNPRAVRKHDLSLTQNSIGRSSLSLKRPNILKPLNKVTPNKENSPNIHNLSQQTQKVPKDLTAKQQVGDDDSIGFSFLEDWVKPNSKENSPNIHNQSQKTQNVPKDLPAIQQVGDDDSIGFSILEDLNLINDSQKANKDLRERRQVANNVSNPISPSGFSYLENVVTNKHGLEELIAIKRESQAITYDIDFKQEFTNRNKEVFIDEEVIELIDSIVIPDSEGDISLLALSSATELKELDTQSASTVTYGVVARPTVKVSFGVNESKTVDVNAKNGAIKRFRISHNDNSTNIDCELIENSQLSEDTEVDENMNETSANPLKRSAVAVSLEIKKKKLTQDDRTENSKVLILNTNAIEKISHVIVQPPNYIFVKHNTSHKSKYKKDQSIRNGYSCAGLKQVTIESFFRQGTDASIDLLEQLETVVNDASKEMSKNLGVIDAVKCDRLKSARLRKDLDVPNLNSKSPRKESNDSPQSARLSPKRDIKTSNSIIPPSKSRNESTSAHTPRKNVESIHFSLPVKSKSNKTSLSPRNIPHHKIVAGTHFAVDAFSYGDIPNVKHYFLTHFHSDHYSGLKKSFTKLLFCSKITADLCISRLGVNPKNIRVINIDEVLRVEGVEVAAVDANHCPGALMLVFTLPNGKTLLHTGDFRACPQMESYPVFWNKDIHTVYLDTTYCNPRYDFPTQDQSLEAALYILRQKKMVLEKTGKKFSSVLIVCGTYTIGKEKFFMGMSRRVGCSVWACPEKERVLQTVEGRSSTREKPEACQLHVVPMRDLTHEKLRCYLDSLRGAFAEVVAFKPSGWENGKNSSVEKDLVTIHGIPYSEHSSFSELIRFIQFLKPKQVVPTVDISGGVKSVQKYFPCPLVYKDEFHLQTKVTDYFSIHNRQQVPAVT